MAHAATLKSHSILDVIATPFLAIGRLINLINETRSASRDFQYLSSLTDQQLDDIGLKREDIVKNVFAKHGL